VSKHSLQDTAHLNPTGNNLCSQCRSDWGTLVCLLNASVPPFTKYYHIFDVPDPKIVEKENNDKDNDTNYGNYNVAPESKM
jgi:hypothetical protein